MGNIVYKKKNVTQAKKKELIHNAIMKRDPILKIAN